ncbi:murC [Wigglesworthia glossinidia endosymbiont of Glossina brevipalpis]|uniref:UDP-N-acetylmuramate--L-alanine ligase n=1 Tax=Wigglesworthia glossinidia brevipalpis TaxID=36870 RepID=MURC_WIGBR|nr:RecName: Full=UDP-N-acetylmuramate--L-alanine ligase; AltName: Full=UDP-N-acetylmuramoyl-L-alanine synthetase [Wigglesworthia glossinidia endosymbiont of Glossina brevipalpis]BAC24351.1 murC [Wigglesworthia glossinidia endosymbiont of Glossina brevipalpis]
MNNLFFSKILRSDNIHFVGIGGVGMGALAEICIKLGYKISGSDIKENLITKKLSVLGAKIYNQHCANNIIESTIIVVSSAIKEDNLEIIYAKKLNIPVVKRAEFLSELMRFKYGIIVSGTHGKTTTTSIISYIYKEAKLFPTYLYGGRLNNSDDYGNLGNSKYWISEADESDNSFLFFRPIISVVTNIEKDHLESYQGNFKKLKESFIKFLHNIPFYGYSVLCLDDIEIKKIIPLINKKIVTYGFNRNSDFCITKFFQSNKKIIFIVYIKHQKRYLKFVSNLLGKHNALNITAAITIAIKEGIKYNIILNSIKKFPGINRRFDFINKYDLSNLNNKKGTITIVDDYGHHPTELKLTIKSVKKIWNKRRLIMIFQPHKYTRTKYLYNYFVKVLSTVDILLIMEIYSAGENPIYKINSKNLCQSIMALKRSHVIFIPNEKFLFKKLELLLKNNDILLLQGAGTIENIFKKLTSKLLL